MANVWLRRRGTDDLYQWDDDLLKERDPATNKRLYEKVPTPFVKNGRLPDSMLINKPNAKVAASAPVVAEPPMQQEDAPAADAPVQPIPKSKLIRMTQPARRKHANRLGMRLPAAIKREDTIAKILERQAELEGSE